ncbi:molybdenum cofactor biosynthesis protein [Acidicapsa acidisoli]|uniref:molybdenum cofactor biosynthesis protein n=1 Tax=Acidicapsa acidisoli TaxID=1615681 RepID=UPI0021E0171B|nr:molybdenum cofactor biosynthesis protein MoaE [Acidicapsa acidisoli]
MRVQILPFGVLKDVLTAAPFELAEQATVGDLLAALGDKLRNHPVAMQLLPRIAVSVNAEYAQPGQILSEGDEVGLLPPVSGGSSESASPVVTYLTREVISADKLVANAKQGSDGAVVVFDGIVRDNTRGRKTLYLDYESYEEMASKQMTELAAQAIERFSVRGVTIVHRLGRLEIGETSVLIVVASAHRGVAFDACRWLIDTLKTTVPIWKKEMFLDGAVWADGEPFPPELAANPVAGSVTGELESGS